MASRFWVGGSGNWDAATTTHWAATTGGGGGQSVPTTSDTVTFDLNSGSATITGTATMNCSTFTSSSALNTFIPGAFTVNVAGAGAAWTWTAGTLTATSSQITCNGAGVTFAGGSKTYNNVTLSGSGTATLSGTNTFGTLTRSGTAVVGDFFTVPAAVTTTCTNFTCTGQSTVNRVKLQTSNVFSGKATISVATTVSVSNTDLLGIKGAGAASWDVSGTSTGDCGDNATLTTSTPQTNYWSSGTGSMSTTANWFLGTGGTGGAGRIPLPQDTAVFDGSSFTAGSQTFTFDMPRFPVVSCTSITNSPTLSLSLAVHQFYGNITLTSGMTFAFGANTLSFNNFAVAASLTTGTATLTASSGSLQCGQGLAGATLTLADNFNFPGTAGIVPIQGTLLAATGVTVTTPLVNMSGGFSTVNLGTNTTWNLTGTSGSVWANGTPSAVSGGSGSTIVIQSTSASSRTFAGGGQTFPTLTYTVAGSTGALVFTGANTFNTINFSDVTNARTMTLPASTTTTITGTFNVNGTSGKLMTISSSSGGTQATLSKAIGGNVSCDYLSVNDSAATGGVAWYAGANSSNATPATNTGWTFSVPPTGSTLLETGVG